MAGIRDLRVEIDGRAIVDGVRLRVLPGRVAALVGASGSGKTTTGLALLGEYPPGARVTGEVWHAMSGPVGYIPQHPASVLNPARSVRAFLRDIARPQVRHLPRTERRAAAHALVLRALADAQLTGAETLLSRHPHQLSGGQQQRVVLAQALLLGARVIVADEPTTGQDGLTKSRVVDQLAALAARGIAVVLLSHDLDVVRALADEVLVMRAGRVVESGPPERLWLAPRHDWTRRLLDDRRPAPPDAHDETTDGAGPTGDSGRADRNTPEGDSRPEGDAGAGTGTGTGTGTEESGRPEGRAPALQVRDLVARHRDGARRPVTVLRAAHLTLRAGECLAVVGRSGSGKTTLARCLAGLHHDHDGEVLLDGTPLPPSLRHRDRSQLAAVQYAFQDARAAFDEHRPVLDQIARTAVRLRGSGRHVAVDEASTTLARMGLDDETARRLPAELSGGELQRAALARALLARPRVLICDEITSGLDTVTRRGILDLLAALLRERADLSLVLITHDLDTARQAHRIAVLNAGEIVEQGAAHEVLTTPRHPFTVSLTEATAGLETAARS